MMDPTNYSFYIKGLTIKSSEEKGEKQHYLKGYISTGDLDSVKDIVTDEALEDMITQLKGRNLKLDVDHELIKKNLTIPFGRITEAIKDVKGVLVEVLLNEKYPTFKDVLSMLQKKFIDALSITFQKPKSGEYYIKGGIRYLKKVNLINVAITAYPANTACRIIDVFTKSLEDIEMDNSGEKQVNELIDKRVKKLIEESKMAEKGPDKDKGKEDEKKALTDKIAKLEAELKEAKESNDEATGLGEQLTEIKGKILEMEEFKGVKDQLVVDKQTEEIEELKNGLSEIFGILHAPQMRGVVSEDVGKAEAKELEDKAAGKKSTGGPLDYIR